MALASTLGTGPNSALVRASMLRDGVENVVQELVGDIGTCTTLIEPGGQRTFITTEGVESEPQLEDLENLKLVPGDYVHAAGYDLVHQRTREGISQWLSTLPAGVQLGWWILGRQWYDILDRNFVKNNGPRRHYYRQPPRN